MARADTLPVFLKAISIQGFKSFADKVKFELGQGLSVVVGPNGSGKSNVADAVRWVLGEQSAKNLRGSKMEDVIFAGSMVRRPVGMAEVSLIFDNSTGIFALDYQEVTITRRVYRDGEGQYFINRSSCRLKDIHELFMDTGAGKEGFSIIGQGRVEEILNLKSEERRVLIEEASGITKYRMRKREALKRMEETEHNLERIEDILTEIEGRLAPLQEQAQKAEQALALTTEQRTLEIQIIVRDLKELRQKLTSATAETEDLEGAVSASLAELGKHEAQILEDKIKLNALDIRIQSAQESAYKFEQALQQTLHEQGLRHERAKHINEQISRLEQEHAANTQKAKQSEERVSALKTRSALLQRTARELDDLLTQDEQRYAEAKKRTGMEETERHKSEFQKDQAEHAAVVADLNRAKQTLLNLEEIADQLRTEKELKIVENDALVKTLQEQQQEMELREAKDKESESLMKGIGAELNEFRQLHDKKFTQVTELNRENERMKGKYQTLKNLEDSLEGYQRGVRELMLAKKKNAAVGLGLCGTLAELITVEERYEVAIETALGGNLQNIVAETEKDAKAAVSYLKTQQLGRATFLPLDVIQGGRVTVNKVVLEDPGFVGIAADLLSYLPKYKPALESQLGRILIVSDMEAATRIARAAAYKARIVTLDGDQVHPGGSLTGGSQQRKGGNLLGRTRELQAIKSDLTEREHVLEKVQLEVLALAEQIRMLSAKDRDLSQLMQTIKEDIAVLRVRERNTQDLITRNQNEQQGLREREHAVQRDSIKEEERIRLLAVNHDDLLEVLAEAERNWQQHEQEAREAAKEAEELQFGLTQTKIQAATYEQELKQAEDSLARETGELGELRSALEQKSLEIDAINEKGRMLSKELDDLVRQHQGLTETLIEAQSALSALRKEREVLSTKDLEREREVQIKRQEQQNLDQKLHGLELRKTRWETEWENATGRLSEEFSLSWEEAEAYLTDRERSSLWTRVQEIKRQLEQLGTINQAALLEHPKAVERYEFLFAQKQDLLEAKLTLTELVGELDKTMSQSFEVGFKAVNEAFQTVFTELFNGGNAELRLDDPENLLETGVEIIAQPPGKKAQLLSLLSGGERALTAIGLLFALLRVKPSPFCILDEIEASLDDANVSRFAKYVNRLSDSTQFLVISHRKGTMEAANTLYGIAMEESGVSKLLSVKLEGQQNESQSA